MVGSGSDVTVRDREPRMRGEVKIKSQFHPDRELRHAAGMPQVFSSSSKAGHRRFGHSEGPCRRCQAGSGGTANFLSACVEFTSPCSHSQLPTTGQRTGTARPKA